MKKWIFLILGSILSLIGLIQCGKLLAYVNELTEMGKGYFIGSLMLFVTGVVLLITGFNIERKSR